MAVALLLTVASNLLGVFTMPLMLPALLGDSLGGAALEPAPLLARLVACVLVPTILGALVRARVKGGPWCVQAWRRRGPPGPFDRGGAFRGRMVHSAPPVCGRQSGATGKGSRAAGAAGPGAAAATRRPSPVPPASLRARRRGRADRRPQAAAGESQRRAAGPGAVDAGARRAAPRHTRTAGAHVCGPACRPGLARPLPAGSPQKHRALSTPVDHPSPIPPNLRLPGQQNGRGGRERAAGQPGPGAGGRHRRALCLPGSQHRGVQVRERVIFCAGACACAYARMHACARAQARARCRRRHQLNSPAPNPHPRHATPKGSSASATSLAPRARSASAAPSC